MTCAAYRWPSSGRFWMSRTAESPLSASIRCVQSARSQRRQVRLPGARARRRDRATMPTSTGTFLPISAASMSTWIFFALRRVGLEVAGDAIVEAHAERDQQVGFLNGRVDPRFAVHAHHAEVERMRRRQAADAEQRHRDRDAGGSTNARNSSIAPPSMMPWPARMTGRRADFDQRERALEGVAIQRAGRRAAACDRRGGVPIELARRLLRVLGDVDQHRTGPARLRDRETPRARPARRRRRASPGSCAW